MKLWLLIYTASGLLGGVAGPLPYDLDECDRRRAALQEAADEKRLTLRFECVLLYGRPEIEAP